MNEALDDRVLRLVDKDTSREAMIAFLHGAMADEPASVSGALPTKWNHLIHQLGRRSYIRA